MKIRKLVPILLAMVLFMPAPAQAKGAAGVVSIDCAFSHANFDDAIVHPGQHNSTHQHGYVGSSDADGMSTVASMENGVSSCALKADTSGYWFPLLISPLGDHCNGTLEGPSPTAPFGQCVYFPISVLVYYNTSAGVRVTMPPEGLQLIGGGITTKSTAYWSCGKPASKHYLTIPACGPTNNLTANVFFPNCIKDGTSIYATICPSGYTQIPSIHFNIHYAAGLGARGWGLDSDFMKGMNNGQSLHGDYWQTWSDQSMLASLIARCDNGGNVCKNVGGKL